MKKLILIAASMLIGVATYAQGTLNFNNRLPGATPPIMAPVFYVDGTTLLAGAGFMAQLYAGAAGSTEAQLVAVGDALEFGTGARAGYIYTIGVDPTRVIPGVAGGADATVQVRAWEVVTGATYETASIKGASALLTIPTGGGGVPPGPAKDLVGLTSFQLVPEPSTIILGLLGAAALLIRRRK